RVNSTNALMNIPIRTSVNNSGFTSIGAITSVSNTSAWNLQIINRGAATRCGIAFSVDSANPTTTKPSADFYYIQTDSTNKLGNLAFGLTLPGSVRGNVFALRQDANYSFRPLFIQSTSASSAPLFNTLVNTGASNVCSNYQSYPFVISSTVGTANVKRCAIAFSESTTNTPPGADIMYVRTNATNDFGDLTINMTQNATTRLSVFNFNGVLNRGLVPFQQVYTVPSFTPVGNYTFCSNTSLYPMSIRHNNSADTLSNRVGLAFAINTSDAPPGFDITYQRGGAANYPSADGGAVFFNMTTSNTLRESVMVFASDNIQINKPINTNIICNALIGIGKTPTATYQLDLSGSNAYKATGTAWLNPSDSRLKEDITDANLTICYNNVKNMKLKYFKLREDIFNDEDISNDRHKLGFIAQEIEPFYPKAVKKSKEPQFGIEECRSLVVDQINYSLFGCVQKLLEKIETLESTVSELQNEIKNLKN
ncbi:MAG: tail fiber domain-containing protein, partial [Bacteroidota bacterium]